MKIKYNKRIKIIFLSSFLSLFLIYSQKAQSSPLDSNHKKNQSSEISSNQNENLEKMVPFAWSQVSDVNNELSQSEGGLESLLKMSFSPRPLYPDQYMFQLADELKKEWVEQHGPIEKEIPAELAKDLSKKVEVFWERKKLLQTDKVKNWASSCDYNPINFSKLSLPKEALSHPLIKMISEGETYLFKSKLSSAYTIMQINGKKTRVKTFSSTNTELNEVSQEKTSTAKDMKSLDGKELSLSTEPPLISFWYFVSHHLQGNTCPENLPIQKMAGLN